MSNKPKPKQERYKSAYSHMYESFVRILKARLVKETYIYDCELIDGTKMMFSEHELRDFTL